MPIGVIILAAGLGRRMGCPKALARVKGTSFLELVRGMLPDLCQVVIVTNKTVAAAFANAYFAQEMVMNPHPASGMSSSVLIGMQALPGCSNYLLFPVDHPLVDGKTIDLLIDATGKETAGMRIVPTFAGRRGHPIIVPGAVETIISKHPEKPLNELLHGIPIKEILVDDGAILKNLNHPEQLESET